METLRVWLEYVNCEFEVLLNEDGLAVIFTDYAGRAIRLTAGDGQMKRAIRWAIVPVTKEIIEAYPSLTYAI